jgi:hypothetical protein
VFEMAPEIVSDEEAELVNGRKVTRKRGKVSSVYNTECTNIHRAHEKRDASAWLNSGLHATYVHTQSSFIINVVRKGV